MVVAKATWNGTVIAETKTFEEVEGNLYFPLESIKKEYFKDTTYTTSCPWKGKANYFTLDVSGQKNENAAWIYKAPFEAAAKIKDHVAFWKGVKVTKE
mmetsp:Transcript_27751/g.49002  ORF Transcript_27751/g.49002 Transcript_27751/m.49002 type:complete len:98 (-) Transcript_27751:74-367(-)|eukprot:CAMPEP_0197514924 /NCGR_PEP_ID=MMETSP1318-20131121/211_1 /TAXON_ID=552666 /ORGANISM="Partenskyella glossopodia, Strain RCC365" /LENGTH=97 /DNA_ID=CAMNT_0043063147 /DNA_START=56 /DNA_END=349 /DNA_ORIENTATION=+